MVVQLERIVFSCAGSTAARFATRWGLPFAGANTLDAAGVLLCFLEPESAEERRRLSRFGGAVRELVFSVPSLAAFGRTCPADHRPTAEGLLPTAPFPLVRHRLIERSNRLRDPSSRGLPIDHLTLACAPGTLAEILAWYQDVLGFVPRLLDGRASIITVHTGRTGLNLAASEQPNSPGLAPFKLTFAEAIDGSSSGQVETFLEANGGPGVQHLALLCSDICRAVDACRERGVTFLAPPLAYYQQPDKHAEILAADHDPAELVRHGILIDTERNGDELTHLLQVFADPELGPPTFFMELIARHGAQGFGRGNVEALFRAVEQHQREQAPHNANEALHASCEVGARDAALEARLQQLAGGPLVYRRPEELESGHERSHEVVVVGSGPIGMTAALILARHGVPVLLLDDDDRLPGGSRAVAWVKTTLEIWDGLGVGASIRAMGIPWARSRMFHRDRLLVDGNLDPIPDQKHGVFAVSLQQYYVEALLLAALRRQPHVSVRWRNRVLGARHDATATGVHLDVETPDGRYRLLARYVVDASGSRSVLRRELLAASTFDRHPQRFLIADLRVEPHVALPRERMFWFDPPFHDGRTALMLPQPDHQLRVDFSLDGEDAGEDELDEQRVRQRACRMLDWLGMETSFTLGWRSVYGFSLGCLQRAHHGAVFFAGDALKSVSPFGARGGNGGIADAANLAWKLALVLRGEADPRLLGTYETERRGPLRDHLAHIRNTTAFMVPDPARSCLRRAALELAAEHPAARDYVNSGRFCRPDSYEGSPLLTPDAETGWTRAGGVPPGCFFIDGALELPSGDQGWLLDRLGPEFTGLYFAEGPRAPVLPGLEILTVRLSPAGEGGQAGEAAAGAELASKYAAEPGTFYLLRPDLYVAARWPCYREHAVRAALRRALGYGADDGTGAKASTVGPADRIYGRLHELLADPSPEQRELRLAKLVLLLAHPSFAGKPEAAMDLVSTEGT